MNYTQQFKKMFWKYLSIIIIPIVFVASVTIGYFFKRLAGDTERLNINIMNHVKEILDTSLGNVMQTSIKLRANEPIAEIAKADRDGENISAFEIALVMREISNYHISDELVESISVYLPKSDLLIDRDTYYLSFKEYSDYFLSADGKDTQVWNEKIKSAGNNGIFTNSEVSGKKFIIYYTALSVPHSKSEAAIIIRIDANALEEKIFFAQESRDKAFAITDNKGNVVYQTSNFATLENKSDFVVESGMLGLKCVFKFLHGGLAGNVYFFMAILVVLLCIAIAVSGLLARAGILKMQRPIKKLYDENEQMLLALNEQIENARDLVLIKFFRRVQTSEKWAEELVERHGPGISGRHFRVAAISETSASMLDYWACKDTLHDSMEQITEILKKNLFEKNVRIRNISFMGRLVFVIGYDDETIDLEDAFEASINQVFLEFKIELIAGLGLEVDNLYEIHKSYEEALVVLRQADSNQNSIAVFDDVSTEKRDIGAEFNKKQEQSLIWCVKNNSQEKLEELLNKIYIMNFSDTRLTQNSLKKYTTQLVCTLYDLVDEAYADDTEMLKRYEMICRNVLKEDNQREVFDVIKKAYHSLCEAFKSRGENDKTLSSMIDYIKRNYMNANLSMDSMASYMNMSYSYFSRMFKEKVGTTFSAYLAAFRMEQAKQLLENTGMSVKQIAEKVGFNDSGTFIRAYKKYYKQTPRNHVGSADLKGSKE